MKDWERWYQEVASLGGSNTIWVWVFGTDDVYPTICTPGKGGNARKQVLVCFNTYLRGGNTHRRWLNRLWLTTDQRLDDAKPWNRQLALCGVFCKVMLIKHEVFVQWRPPRFFRVREQRKGGEERKLNPDHCCHQRLLSRNPYSLFSSALFRVSVSQLLPAFVPPQLIDSSILKTTENGSDWTGNLSDPAAELMLIFHISSHKQKLWQIFFSFFFFYLIAYGRKRGRNLSWHRLIQHTNPPLP